MGFNIRGYMIDETDFVKIHEKIQQFREIILVLAREKMEDFHEHVFNQLEEIVRQKKKTTLSHDSYPHSLWMERRREIESSGYTDFAVDTGFEVTLFPLRDATLFTCYTVEHKWTEKFVRFLKAKDFSCWDGSDRPERITEHEWQQRRATWDKILAPTYIPSLSGYSIKLIHDFEPHPSDSDIESYRKKIEKLELLMQQNAEASNLPQET